MHVIKLSFKKLNPDVQYGNEEAGIEALPGSEGVENCFMEMKQEVYNCLGLDLTGAVTTKKEETVKETPKKEEPKKEKKTKAKKEKAPVIVLFNADNETHRDLAAEELSIVCPGWDENADLTSQASKLIREGVVGKEFLDDKGNMLQSFKDLIASGMATGETKKGVL